MVVGFQLPAGIRPDSRKRIPESYHDPETPVNLVSADKSSQTFCLSYDKPMLRVRDNKSKKEERPREAPVQGQTGLSGNHGQGGVWFLRKDLTAG
jgi:hypothetical protein